MNRIGMKTFGLMAAAAAYSHAIFGIGGQWAPAMGLEVKGSSQTISDAGTTAFSINQEAVEGLNGFGAKIWIDALPFIDIEAASNIQMGYYDLSVSRGGDTVAVKAELDVPFVEGKPVFARIVSDLSVLYPFLKLPPVVSLVKLYAGGGVTHVLSTEVVNAAFAKKAVQSAVTARGAAAADTPEELGTILADAVVDEGLTSGVGFHLMAGAKVKPPIIPLAAFINFKYHFLNSQPDAVDGSSMTLEVGGALAF